MTQVTLLLIEDDLEISRLMELYLGTEGFKTITVDNGLDANQMIKDLSPDLVLLDLMLPGKSGNDVCKEAREFYDGPILVLTACSDDISEVSLLRLGADDFVTKPVKPHVLVARIEALLRRTNRKYIKSVDEKRKKIVGSIEVDTVSRQVYFKQKELEVSAAEFEMLLLLVENVGKVVTREDCCRSLRGVDYGYNDRSIDMRVSILRKKLEDTKGPYRRILTIRNKGYMLVDE